VSDSTPEQNDTTGIFSHNNETASSLCDRNDDSATTVSEVWTWPHTVVQKLPYKYL